MILRILGWLGASSGVGALLYWQVVLAEGAYLGPRAVRCIYQLGAQRYDAVRQPWQQSADAILLPHLHAALANRNAPRILDVATGTGRVPRLLCADPSFHGVVTALDLTPAMLAQARRKAPALPVLWLQAEANALPGTAASVDLVTCLEALEYFPQPRQALHEMVRVLRPGGTLLLSKVPDNWARLLPGRALQRSQLAQTLHDLGCADVHFAPWQDGHYELVWAKRR